MAVYQVGEDRQIPFIAMPLLRGETLAERLAAARIPAPGLDKETRRQGDKEKSASGPPLTIGVGHGDDVPGNAAAPDGTQSSSRENLPLSPCPLVSLSSSNRERFVSPSGPAPITNTEPPPPRELNAALPGEINDLIVSLLCKEPAGWPRSAREVAERLAGWALAILPLPPGEGRGEGGMKPGEAKSADAGAPSSAARPHPNPLREGEGTNAAPPAALKLLRQTECDGMGGGRCNILALRWSADGRTLQVFDRTAAYVFDATSGELRANAPRLDNDKSYLRRANFSPDGRYLGVATTCTRVWDLAELNHAALEDGPPGPSSQDDGLGRPSSEEGDGFERQASLRLAATDVAASALAARSISDFAASQVVESVSEGVGEKIERFREISRSMVEPVSGTVRHGGVGKRRRPRHVTHTRLKLPHFS